MYIIVGLGNPGRDYINTRHNIGFDVIDVLAEMAGISVIEKKHKAIIGKGILDGQKVILVKPQTYMNLSGESVRDIIDYYKVDEEQELIVVSDDTSLDVGSIRVRKKGSAGGHNGIKSIISHLGSQNFMRIKVGVGEKPKEYDLADYVLGHFSKADREGMQDGYRHAMEAVEQILLGDIEAAMNCFNKKVKGKE
jgi:PTH1 family peptidyl-tRNA hydrolase